MRGKRSGRKTCGAWIVELPEFFHRCFLLSALLASVALVSSCSTNYLYERLDWFVVWQVGGLVTLTDAQEEVLQQDVKEYLDKVRVHEMPRAADFIRSVSRQIDAGDVTASDIDERYYESMEFYEEVMLGVVPISRKFFLNLSEKQIEELVESLYAMNDEMYEEYSGRTAEEREKNRNKSAVEGVQRFTGRLSDAQKELIESRMAGMEDSSEQWIAYQREWQDQFKALLLERPAEAEFSAELTALFVYPRKFHSPEYKAIVEENRQQFNAMMTDLLSSLTSKQRDHMLRELDEYVQLLTKLSTMSS